jgi:Xaa-Pro aminopeptidase
MTKTVDPAIPQPAPIGPLAGAPTTPLTEPRGLVGPTGTFGVETYRKRRHALMDKLGTVPTAALIAQEMNWVGDREGMDYYYLTGIEEPGGALLLMPTAPVFKERLFLARHDVEDERVSGERASTPSKALEVATGIASIGREQKLVPYLVGACSRFGSLTYVGAFSGEGDKPKVMDYYAKTMERVYGCKTNDLHLTLARMREVKEPEELALMRKAIAYTAAGHAQAIKVIRAGAREFEVKDAVEDAFRHAGARHVAYDSIVGSGRDGAVLHYPKDDRTMNDGELLLIDAAAEAENYASDVTRTYPVNGKYSKEQRDIYDVVLRAQAAGIAAAKAGVTVEQIDLATRKVVEDAGYYDYYVHGCCHFVGLAVHDAGDYYAPLPVGAVITVEPGIYLPDRGLGVRIEDEILITATGAEVLSKAIPKDPDEIERLMKLNHAAP